MFDIILTILIAIAAFWCGVLWERYQWETYINEEIFNYDDLGI